FSKKTKRYFGAVGLFLSKSSLRRIFRYFYFRIKPNTLAGAKARGPNIGEKPNTLVRAEARGPNIGVFVPVPVFS
ncbi:hypothetical protein, partial [Paenibacillus rhizoplanae]